MIVLPISLTTGRQDFYKSIKYSNEYKTIYVL